MISTLTNYKMEAYRLMMMVLIYVSKSLGKITPNAPCYPRLTAVAIDQPDHKFFPYFIDLLRCSGSYRGNSPNRFECVPDQTKDVTLTRYNVGTQGFETLTLRGKDGNHTSCMAGCTIKPEQCLKPNIYDSESCTCSCNHQVAPVGYECPAKKSWYTRTCSCHCATRQMCTKRYTWSNDKCECICKPKRRQNCTFKGGIFDETSCGCRFFGGKSTQVNGKFIGSRAFWCYALIGEFLVMLVVFDMILFCKKSGFLYKCTKRCRTVEDDHSQSTKAIGDGDESCKTTFSSLQSINAFNYQLPPTSIKHGPYTYQFPPSNRNGTVNI